MNDSPVRTDKRAITGTHWWKTQVISLSSFQWSSSRCPKRISLLLFQLRWRSFELTKTQFHSTSYPKKISYHSLSPPYWTSSPVYIHLYPCLYKKLWVIPHSTMLWKIKWVVLKVIYWEALGGDINGSTCWNINQTMPSLGTKHSYPPLGCHIKWCEECLPAWCLQEKICMLLPLGFLSSLGGKQVVWD